jgi:outer membrane immunogenic protein
VLAGLQAGYNWEAGALVVGLEGDWSWTGLRDRAADAISASALVGAGLGAITTPVDGFVSGIRSEIDWLATARGRIGFASGNMLIYGTGGLAFAEVDTRAGFFAFAPARSPDPIPAVSREQSARVGWTVGAGVEAALANNLSAKLEYLYADLGRDRTVLGAYIDAPGNLFQSATLDEKVTLHSVKLGLNYRFAGP